MLAANGIGLPQVSWPAAAGLLLQQLTQTRVIPIPVVLAPLEEASPKPLEAAEEPVKYELDFAKYRLAMDTKLQDECWGYQVLLLHQDQAQCVNITRRTSQNSMWVWRQAQGWPSPHACTMGKGCRPADWSGSSG